MTMVKARTRLAPVANRRETGIRMHRRFKRHKTAARVSASQVSRALNYRAAYLWRNRIGKASHAMCVISRSATRTRRRSRFGISPSNAMSRSTTATELCAKCHAEQHGFEVIWEQSVSPAHKGWECTRCHGSHNTPVKCTDCHDPTTGRGAAAHAQHPKVGCTACHDAGGLSIWQDPNSDSRYYQMYMPERFAHALRSWPSHNLQAAVDCRRCHHPQGDRQMTLASNIRCDNSSCHPNGASFNWCPVIPRDAAPK